MVSITDESGVRLGFEALSPHPSTPPRAAFGVWFDYSWQAADRWVITFTVDAPYHALRLPEAIDFSRTDELWRTTCFELFLRRPGQDAYLEFNFAPSGQWAAYGFDGYRDKGADPQNLMPIVMSPMPGQSAEAQRIKMIRMGIEPEVAAKIAGGDPHDGTQAQVFVVIVELDGAGFDGSGPWEVSVSAVIEEADGTLSYWALAHPSDKPDFHHPDSFALDLS